MNEENYKALEIKKKEREMNVINVENKVAEVDKRLLEREKNISPLQRDKHKQN